MMWYAVSLQAVGSYPARSLIPSTEPSPNIKLTHYAIMLPSCLIVCDPANRHLIHDGFGDLDGVTLA